MITKERLEELIKQGAIVYCFTFDEVLEEKLGQNHFVDWELDDMFLSKWDEDTHEPICDIYYIFEHKEEAEYFQWSFEFGCIERTERLELPTWEELRNESEKNGCYGCEIFFMGFDEGKEPMQFMLDVRPDDKIYIGFTKEIGAKVFDIEFEALTTKENYTLACRKCKELFLNGNVND